MANWRRMTGADLPLVQAIADSVHLDFYERPEVLTERLALYPAGCLVRESEGGLLGYVFSHPWRAADLPPLDTLLHALPAGAETYYLHDLCLLPAARGTGAGGELVGLLVRHAAAHGFHDISLVAVNGSVPFWTRQGFVAVELPSLREKLMSYEREARYMKRVLTPKEPK